jgi:hypothetical protein
MAVLHSVVVWFAPAVVVLGELLITCHSFKLLLLLFAAT